MKSSRSVHTEVLALLLGLAGVILILPGCNREQAGEGRAGISVPDEGDHEGEVRLDHAQVAAAGIEVVEVGPGTIKQVLRLAARITANEDTVVHVNPQVEGIVQVIHKGLGDKVKAGEPLAELWSVELGTRISDYLEAHAMAEAAEETLEKTSELFDQRMKTLLRVVDGEIEVAQRIYDREKELQEKGISTIRPFLEAEKALLKARLAKDREITDFHAERTSRLLALEVALREVRIQDVATKGRLLALGLKEEQIEEDPDIRGHSGHLVIRAPRDGVVVGRHITVNEHVNTDTVLFELQDLSVVWLIASAYEKDLPLLREGQDAIVRLDAFPNETLTGKVGLIDYQISASTRAAAIRIELENGPMESWSEEFPLRPGMFGSAELITGSRTGGVVVSEQAIVHEGEDDYVFVQGDGGVFHRRTVTVLKGARGLVEIVKGVDPGERVVVSGTFSLKSMARSSELGEGHSH